MLLLKKNKKICNNIWQIGIFEKNIHKLAKFRIYCLLIRHVLTLRSKKVTINVNKSDRNEKLMQSKCKKIYIK